MESTNTQEIPKTPHQEVIETMTNIMNYLSVSLYESQFTKNHEDSYMTLCSIYTNIASDPSTAPHVRDIKQFYDNIVYLGSVTYTDDPDYYKYKIILRKYISNQPNLFAKNISDENCTD